MVSPMWFSAVVAADINFNRLQSSISKFCWSMWARQANSWAINTPANSYKTSRNTQSNKCDNIIPQQKYLDQTSVNLNPPKSPSGFLSFSICSAPFRSGCVKLWAAAWRHFRFSSVRRMAGSKAPIIALAREAYQRFQMRSIGGITARKWSAMYAILRLHWRGAS